MERKREKTKDEERRRAAKRLSRTAEDEPDAAKKQMRNTDDREMFLMCAEDDRDQYLDDYKNANLEEYEINDRWADWTEDEEVHHDNVYDDLTGKHLDGKEVRKARLNEIEALVNMQVWDIVPVSSCMSAPGRNPSTVDGLTSTRETITRRCIDPATSPKRSRSSMVGISAKACLHQCLLSKH